MRIADDDVADVEADAGALAEQIGLLAQDGDGSAGDHAAAENAYSDRSMAHRSPEKNRRCQQP
jgi:hypothetical protein